MSRRYNRYGFDEPSVILSGGPSHSRQADDDDPPYEPPRHPFGFVGRTTRLVDIDARGVVHPHTPPDPEPLLWDGDQA